MDLSSLVLSSAFRKNENQRPPAALISEETGPRKVLTCADVEILRGGLAEVLRPDALLLL